MLTQTRRHSYIVSLLGIRHVVLAINKMDLMEYSQQTFDEIVAAYREFAQQIGLTDITAIPLSALRGDNMLERSERMRWYQGPTLMSYLESVEIEDDLQTRPLLARAVGQPAEPGFSRLRRHDRERHRPPRRQLARAAVGPTEPRHAHRQS